MVEALLSWSGSEIVGWHGSESGFWREPVPTGFSRSPLKTWTSEASSRAAWTCAASGPLKKVLWSMKARPGDKAEPSVFCGLLHEGGHLEAPLYAMAVCRRFRMKTLVRVLRPIENADGNVLADEGVAARWARKAARGIWGARSTEDRLLAAWDNESDQPLSMPWMTEDVAPHPDAIAYAIHIKKELDDEAKTRR